MGLLSRIRNWFIESERNYYKFWTGQIKRCPICGHKAVVIHYCGENKPEWFRIECGDFEDHGLWGVPGKCNFMGCISELECIRHYTLADAVTYWNDTVVPIGLAARIAMIRMQEYKEGKRNRFDMKSVTLPPLEEENEEKKDGK